MSLYREAGRRRKATAIAAAAALAAGLLSGVLIGRATVSEPSLAEQVREVQARGQTVVQGFELVRTHYPRDRDAGRSQARRAQEEFAKLRSDLATLDRTRADKAARAVAKAVRATDRNARPSLVDAAAGRAIDTVRAAALLGD